ncbi:MAG TPA: response regulator [Elusimicrobiota bacterium]|nr:response regulator [Elusimicrobiota bacterium]
MADGAPPEPSPILDLGFKQKTKVLIAEDELNIASMLEDWLSEYFDILLAANGKSALQKAKWEKPAILVLDIVMPDMGGYEVCRALQSDPATNQIPIIAMTAKSFDDSTVRMIKQEPNVLGFINKPFRPEALKAKIEQILADRDAAPVPTVMEEPAPVPPKKEPVRTVEPAAPIIEPPPPEPVPPPPPTDRTPTMREKPLRTPVPAVIPEEETPSRSWMGTLVGLSIKLILLTAAVLSAAEWTCRLTEKALSMETFFPPVTAAHRPERVFEIPAGARWSQGGISYELSPWGLRDTDYPIDKKEETLRIMMLGGSTLFGERVPVEQTCAKQLERLLNTDIPAEASYKRVEVMNAGLWKYTLSQTLSFFSETGRQFQPDLLLIAYELDDELGDLAWRAAGKIGLMTTLDGALRFSHLYRLSRYLFLSAAFSLPSEVREPPRKESFEEARRTLRQWDADSPARHQWVIIPSWRRLSGNRYAYERIHAQLSESIENQGATAWDPWTDLSGRTDNAIATAEDHRALAVYLRDKISPLLQKT